MHNGRDWEAFYHISRPCEVDRVEVRNSTIAALTLTLTLTLTLHISRVDRVEVLDDREALEELDARVRVDEVGHL